MIKSDTGQANQTLSSQNPFRKNADSLPSKNPFNKEHDPSCLPSERYTSLQPDTVSPSTSQNDVRLNSGASVDKQMNEETDCPSEDNKVDEEEEVEDGISYDPTPYDTLGFRIGSPPPQWKEGETDGKSYVQQPTSTQQPDTKQGDSQPR